MLDHCSDARITDARKEQRCKTAGSLHPDKLVSTTGTTTASNSAVAVSSGNVVVELVLLIPHARVDRLDRQVGLAPPVLFATLVAEDAVKLRNVQHFERGVARELGRAHMKGVRVRRVPKWGVVQARFCAPVPVQQVIVVNVTVGEIPLNVALQPRQRPRKLRFVYATGIVRELGRECQQRWLCITTHLAVPRLSLDWHVAIRSGGDQHRVQELPR